VSGASDPKSLSDFVNLGGAKALEQQGLELLPVIHDRLIRGHLG